MRRVFHILPVGILLALIAASVASLPRLAVEQSASCQSCHINPAGGGMRNEFGNHAVAFHELTLPAGKKLVEDRFKPPRLAESVTFGFDVRYLVFDDGNVFRMQTDAYLAAEPLRDFFYQFRVGAAGISENYALLYFDRQRHFAKAGRFQPSHGLRIADHTAFIRSRTGTGPDLYLDGLAVGATFASIHATAEAFNPNDRALLVFHAYRPGYLPSLGLGYLVGLSARFSETISALPAPYPDTRTIFGGLSYGRFTLLGQLDLAGRSPDTLAAYASLTARLEYGLYLLAEYNFFDGDRDRADGVDEFLRLSLELFPIPFVELRPSYTRHTRGALDGQDDFFLQLHFGY